ncbi:MAG: oligopeptide transporter, OPT family [Acidobacteria bacterium SCN 69-37]|nr:MAG: oligopeptide transporter, OPT family [Acidobacteria bacterium SCN 69-37]
MPHPAPVVPPEQSPPELTGVALALGSVLSIVMGAANVYLGLYAGMTVAASIPASVISMTLLRGLLGRSSILENNIVQTMASTGEALAAGVIFTVPALLLVGAWQDFQFWPTTLIVSLGGLLGIVFMVPMRQALVVDRTDLSFPEGTACAEVLKVGEAGGTGARLIGTGILAGGLFKVAVNAVRVVLPTVEGAVGAGRTVWYGGADMSAALVAVGYIVRLEIAALVFAGGAIGWILALPWLGGAQAGEPALDAAWRIWSADVRYIGVGAMVVGGLASFWSVRRGIVSGIRTLGAVGRGIGGDASTSVIPRTERNLSLVTLGVIFVVTTAATMAFYQVLVGTFGVAALATVLMVVAAFLLVAVATYIAGLVGSSNSPVSGMTIVALLFAAAVMLGLGVSGDSAILATLGIAGVVCCATCASGDMAQDLKTGLLVGATPARQQLASIVATILPALCFAPILTLLHHAYGIGTGEPGSLRAPQAALFASLTTGIFGGGGLPWHMMALGAAIGLVLLAIDARLARTGGRIRAHVMPIAVGMYLPFSLAVPILIGGLVSTWTRRGRPATGEDEGTGDRGLLFASGLIAGEALVGIVIAGIIAAQVPLPIVLVDSPLLSLAVFAALVWGLARAARRVR